MFVFCFQEPLVILFLVIVVTTKDQDHDGDSSGNCAVQAKGAWWYWDCRYANLNGLYHHGKHSNADGINWYHWKGHYYSTKRAEMKIRPVHF